MTHIKVMGHSLRLHLQARALLVRHSLHPDHTSKITSDSGNILGMAFPLFTKQMYKTLDFKWANTLFGCLGTAMVPIPFVHQFLP